MSANTARRIGRRRRRLARWEREHEAAVQAFLRSRAWPGDRPAAVPTAVELAAAVHPSAWRIPGDERSIRGWVEAPDDRLVCTNGMIRAAAVRQAHLGRSGARGLDAIEDARAYFRDATRAADDRAFVLKVTDAVGAMFDPARFHARLDQYRAAGGRRIEADPVRVVEATARRLTLTEGEKSSVLQHLIRGGDLSAWGLANAVTRPKRAERRRRRSRWCGTWSDGSALSRYKSRLLDLSTIVFHWR
jgi:hypothetical protein